MKKHFKPHLLKIERKRTSVGRDLENGLCLDRNERVTKFPENTIKDIFKECENGVIVKDTFVDNTVLQEITRKIENLEDMQWSSVKQVLHEYGLDESVLRQLGFSIEWKTLDMKNAVVKKI